MDNPGAMLTSGTSARLPRARTALAALALAVASGLAGCARGNEKAPRPGPTAGFLASGPARASASPWTCDPAPRIAPLPHGEGVRRMAARLDAIVRGLDPRLNIFLNAGRVARLETELATS